MDRFYDGQYMRLRNRKLDKHYLHADDDGEGVSIRQRRNSLNVAWKVHIYHGADGPYLLLHSSAYGRYLAATATEAPSFHHGFRAQLRDYDHPVVPEIMWLDIRAGRGRGVLLQNAGDRYLRANGKYLRWNTGVTVENRDIEMVKVSSMMRWIVEPIALTERPPRIPAPIRARLPDDLSVIVFGRQPGAWRGIRCVQASADGLFPEAEQGWVKFHFRGRSLYHLRDKLARQVNQQPEGIAMCIRAGRYGRPTPLVVDLPHGGWGDILQIAFFVSGTPAYDALRYPNVGRSLYHLRDELARQVNQQPDGIAMCIRAGRYGRPTPLVIDLPRGGWGDILQTVVIISGTPVLAFAEQSIGEHGSGEVFPKQLEENNDCRSQPSQAGSEQSHRQELLHNPFGLAFAGLAIGNQESDEMFQEEPEESQAGSPQSVPREELHNPSGSAAKSLTEHPDVFIEAARAKFLVATNRSRSITKELNQARDTLAHQQQQNVAALPKEERKVAIKEMRKLKEKVSKLGVAAALADEEFAKEQDEFARAVLRHGL